ncbi:cysteine-rich repeat secretory protein 38 [Phtheirospermum japonicum]|uniref:Cysteine-rich repeat secretory protein 38 n=1 Tax=Phtheirospermum japonicum TaxID=374723 RepID=A0A830CCG9_9LAMI|nr:cysteine-rich repeat secretory protein 38 [Phtheirospermum japonicum]
MTLINTHCPENRTAIIWRDYCFFKYSDVEFFGQIDTDNRLNLTDGKYWNRSSSMSTATRLLSDLSQTAIQSPKFFAIGSTGSLSGELYAMAQCTRDLSANSCSTCLGQALTDLSNCCFGKEGVRVFCGSCNVRYETYNFLTN